MGKYVKQSLILFTIMSFMLFGCGGTQAENAQNSEPQESEVVNDVEETVEETPTAKEMGETEESDGITESFETEEQNQAPTQMVDWETFATQADNDKICMVVSNETSCEQKVLYDGGFYPYKEGDRIAIPIKENIRRVRYYASDEKGKRKGEVIDLYWKDKDEVPYIEFEVGKESGYYISISDISDNRIVYCISTVAEVD